MKRKRRRGKRVQPKERKQWKTWRVPAPAPWCRCWERANMYDIGSCTEVSRKKKKNTNEMREGDWRKREVALKRSTYAHDSPTSGASTQVCVAMPPPIHDQLALLLLFCFFCFFVTFMCVCVCVCEREESIIKKKKRRGAAAPRLPALPSLLFLPFLFFPQKKKKKKCVCMCAYVRRVSRTVDVKGTISFLFFFK